MKKEDIKDQYSTESKADKVQTWQKEKIESIKEALEEREKPNPIFNDIPYSENYISNLKRAINYSPNKKVGEDREISMGLIPEKIFGYISIVMAYFMKRQFDIYKKDGGKIKGFGEFFELSVEYTQRLEKLKEKKLAILFFEIFTQGDAFVLEDWIVENKTPQIAYDKDGNEVNLAEMDYSLETLEGFSYKDGKDIQTRRAEAKVLDGRKVILGDITINDIQNQPFIAIGIITPNAKADKLYGSLTNFKKLKNAKDRKQYELLLQDEGISQSLFSDKVFDYEKEKMVHLYFNKEDNLYNIFVNGIAMLPIETPLSIFYPRMNYPIVQFTSERISGSAYSRSVPAKLKFTADYLDWQLKVLAEKFEQGVYPALLVKSSYAMSKNILKAGERTEGVAKEDYERADPDNQGITSSEFSFTQMMKEILEQQSLNSTTSGELSGQATATEVGIVDQAQNTRLAPLLDSIVMGFTDLALRRAETIESKFTIKQDETIVDGKTIDLYQNFSVNIGNTENIVDFRPEISELSEEEVDDLENNLHKKETEMNRNEGIQSRFHLVDPVQVRKGDYVIQCTIKPEKRKEGILQLMELEHKTAFLLNTFPNSVDKQTLQKQYLEATGDTEKLFLPPELASQINAPPEGLSDAINTNTNTGSMGKPQVGIKPSMDSKVQSK